MSLADEYFGTPAQQDLARRARALFDVVKDDPRFTYYGRGVGIVRPQDGGIDLMSAVIALSGACHFAATADDEVPQIEATLQDRGLSTTVFVRWTGGDDAIAKARDIVAQTACPTDVTIHNLNADSPPEHLIKLAEVAETGGVLAPAGSVLRGQTRPGAGHPSPRRPRTGRVLRGGCRVLPSRSPGIRLAMLVGDVGDASRPAWGTTCPCPWSDGVDRNARPLRLCLIHDRRGRRKRRL